MIEKNKNYFINNPIFLKYKTKFNWLKLTRVKRLRKVFINERIVELPFVFRSLGQKRNIKILDLGCSESSLSLHLSSLGYQVTGVDMRSFPYLHPKFNFVKANIMNMGFPDSSFDTVTCISTLEHIGLGFYADSQSNELPDQKAIAEVSRILRKEGLLLLSVPFGIFKETRQQRIYDSSSLESLLGDFIIEEKLFFADFRKPGNNYWEEVGQPTAEKIDSKEGKTNCVCLIKACKK